MVSKQQIKGTLLLQSFSLLIFTSVSFAESVGHYFDNNDSTIYKNIDTSSSNLNDKNPIIIVNSFNLSKLKDIAEYAIQVSDLEEITSKDQKENNNRYNISRLEVLADNLSLYYRKKGLILTKVYFPPQNLKNKSLYLDLVMGEIEQVTTNKNDYYSSDRLRRPFRDLIDKPAFIPSLESSLIELNDYPGLSIDTRFREGSQIGKTQIDIFVKEERITDFNFSFDNYGSEYTGTMRGNFTADLFNIADKADKLSFNALATFNPTNSVFLGASYGFKVAPYFENHLLNSAFRHGLNVSFGYQETQYSVGGKFKELNIEGKASSTFLQLDKNLILRNSHRLNTGVKLTKKLIETSQGNSDPLDNQLSIFTWSTLLRWNDHFSSPSANLIKLDIHKGLPGFAGAMKNDDPMISRQGIDGEIAAMDYTRYNLLLSRNQGVGPYRLITKINIQHTDDLLLPSEQVNLGGATSVRGYANSDFSGDNSRVISIEIAGKSSARKFSLPISDLKLAAFIDHGVATRFKPLDSEDRSAEMTSIGGYVQFLKEGKFSSKIELAMPLVESGNSKKNKFDILFNFDRGF